MCVTHEMYVEITSTSLSGPCLAGRVPWGLSIKKASVILGPPWPFASPLSLGTARRPLGDAPWLPPPLVNSETKHGKLVSVTRSVSVVRVSVE